MRNEVAIGIILLMSGSVLLSFNQKQFDTEKQLTTVPNTLQQTETYGEEETVETLTEDRKQMERIQESDFERVTKVKLVMKQKTIADAEKIDKVIQMLCNLKLEPIDKKETEDIYGSTPLAFEDGDGNEKIITFVGNQYLVVGEKSYRIIEDVQITNHILEQIIEIFD